MNQINRPDALMPSSLTARKNNEETARLLSEKDTKRLFPERFNSCSCHAAFPDQLHTFIGDCSSGQQVVALVPRGDVRFTANQLNGLNLIAVVGESVSADYLEFLEDMQISYVFAGKDGRDTDEMAKCLLHDFGIKELEVFKS